MPLLTWPEVYHLLQDAPAGRLYGVPRGGSIVAGLTGRAVDNLEDADAIVDDIIDSGATRDRYAYTRKPFWALVDKTKGAEFQKGWVVFPWEGKDPTSDLEDTVRRQLEWIGEDPKRDGLKDTPKRVLKALKEMTSGYSESPRDILSKVFDIEYDEVVMLRDVSFTSMCEHHMLPFIGTATVGYLPGVKVVGLSKLARLVHAHAKRLQVQERLTRDIANDIMRYLEPKGAAVVIKAQHMCMSCRGVKENGSEMVTSAMLGEFRTSHPLRSEFLSYATNGHT